MSEYHRVRLSCQRGSLRKLTELRCSREGQEQRDAQANGALWAEAEDAQASEGSWCGQCRIDMEGS